MHWKRTSPLSTSILGRLQFMVTDILCMYISMKLLLLYHHNDWSTILRHIGLLEADEDKIWKIRPKGTQVRSLGSLYVPREVDLADKTRGAQRPESGIPGGKRSRFIQIIIKIIMIMMIVTIIIMIMTSSQLCFCWIWSSKLITSFQTIWVMMMMIIFTVSDL